MEMRPLGVRIAEMLAARGVSTVFGIPGVHNVELYRGIEEAGITHVLARHEQGAGFMADGYARATGEPGIAFVITGPGLLNILTPLGQAYSDSVPMLVISTCLDRADLGLMQGRLHEMKDQELAGEAVADWSRTAMDAASAYALINRAFGEFAAGRARPKHIQIPIDVLAADAPPPPPVSGTELRPIPSDAQDIAQVLRLLARAEKPLFVFGGGAVRGWEAARAVLEATGAASFTTTAGRGIVADDAPFHYGAYLARPGSADVFAEADLVIVAGSELSEGDLWRAHLGHRCPLVRVDNDPAMLADRHRADVTVRADATGFLKALEMRLSGHQPNSRWSEAAVAAARQSWRAEVAAERRDILPVLDALKDVLPTEKLIYSDMTQFAYVANEVFVLDEPGQWHHPTGFGTLGYALPAAIGAKAAFPDMPVIAIAGDYGFQYTLPELGTAVELGQSLPIIIWDNDGLKEIEDCMTEAEMPPRAVTARNPDFVALAGAYGMTGVRPGSLAEMQTALAEALLRPAPTLIILSPEISE